MKELICICCPRGCHLQVDETQDYAVTGNACPRGAEYGRAECTAPTRVVTSTVAVRGAAYPRCPVKTAAPIPKGKIFEVMATLDGLTLRAPVTLGQVVVKNAAGTGVDVVATRTLE
ncbi:MAG: DUF1667 domain-containing protein [Gemmiger sp.]|nr:DUF1667 domain-containing protein [Gemmiger sp.]